MVTIYFEMAAWVPSLLLLVGKAKTLTPHAENEYQVSKTFDELERFLKYKVNPQTWLSLYDTLRNTLYVRNTHHRTTTRMRGQYNLLTLYRMARRGDQNEDRNSRCRQGDTGPPLLLQIHIVNLYLLTELGTDGFIYDLFRSSILKRGWSGGRGWEGGKGWSWHVSGILMVFRFKWIESAFGINLVRGKISERFQNLYNFVVLHLRNTNNIPKFVEP